MRLRPSAPLVAGFASFPSFRNIGAIPEVPAAIPIAINVRPAGGQLGAHLDSAHVARTIEPEFEELHQTEERLRAVIDSAPVGILEVDLQSRVIRWNSAAERIFGWSREEIVGRP